MTDLKQRFQDMFDGEPAIGFSVERTIADGRRALRRRSVTTTSVAVVTTAAAVSGAVAIPLTMSGGSTHNLTVGPAGQPTTAPTGTGSSHSSGQVFVCRTGRSHGKKVKALEQLAREKAHEASKNAHQPGRVSVITKRQVGRAGHQRTLVCLVKGKPIRPSASLLPPAARKQGDQSAPSGNAYHYTEDPRAIAQRLGDHLAAQLKEFGLVIDTSPGFGQESNHLAPGFPPYFNGYDDVTSSSGNGDVGVQVIHKSTTKPSFPNACDPAKDSQCTVTTLADGSTLQTDLLPVGDGQQIVTAAVARPNGVLVQAQESNYPFASAGQPAKDQPLPLDRLVKLAEDPAFTF